MNFITLTISGKQNDTDHSHNKKVLNQFFTELRSEKHGIQHYVWKLEKQKNGNIHYHIVTDKRIDKMVLRTMWNRIQNKFGYVTLYRNKHKDLTFEQYCEMYPTLKKFKNKKGNSYYETKKDFIKRKKKAFDFGIKTDWFQPNSTDIHKLYDVENIVAYISKYMSKTDDKGIIRNTDGKIKIARLWGCSQGLSQLRKFTVYPDSFNDDFQQELKTIEENTPKNDMDYLTVIYVGFVELVQKGYKELSNMYLAHINWFRHKYKYPLLELTF